MVASRALMSRALALLALGLVSQVAGQTPVIPIYGDALAPGFFDFSFPIGSNIIDFNFNSIVFSGTSSIFAAVVPFGALRIFSLQPFGNVGTLEFYISDGNSAQNLTGVHVLIESSTDDGPTLDVLLEGLVPPGPGFTLISIDLSDITQALGAIVLLSDSFTYDTITIINYNTEIVSFVVDGISIQGQALGAIPAPATLTCDESFENFFISSSLIVYEENLNPVFQDWSFGAAINFACFECPFSVPPLNGTASAFVVLDPFGGFRVKSNQAFGQNSIIQFFINDAISGQGFMGITIDVESSTGSATPIMVPLLDAVVDTLPGGWLKIELNLLLLGAGPTDIFDIIEIHNGNNQVDSFQLDSFLVLPSQPNLCPDDDEFSDFCNIILGMLDSPFQNGTFPIEDAQVGYTLQDECTIYYANQFSEFMPDCFGFDMALGNLTGVNPDSSNFETCVTGQACGEFAVALNLGSPYDEPSYIESEMPIVADANEFGFLILASIQGDSSNVQQSQPIISNFDPNAQTGYFLSCEPGSGTYGVCEYQLEIATTNGMLIVESGLPAIIDEFALIAGCYSTMGTPSAVDDEVLLVVITSSGRISVSTGNGDASIGPFSPNTMEPLRLGTDPTNSTFFTGLLDEFYQLTACPSFDFLSEIASNPCFGLSISAGNFTDMMFGSFSNSPSFYSLISPIYEDSSLIDSWMTLEFDAAVSLENAGLGFPRLLNGEGDSGTMSAIVARVNPFGGLRFRSNNAPINEDDYLVFYFLAEVGEYQPVDIIISNQITSLGDAPRFPLSDFAVVIEGGWVFIAIPLTEFGVTFGFGLDIVFFNPGFLPYSSFRIDNMFLGGFHMDGTPCLTDPSVCLRALPEPPVRVTVRRTVYEDDALEDEWQDFSFGTTNTLNSVADVFNGTSSFNAVMPPFSGVRLTNEEVPFSGEHVEFWFQFVAGFLPVIPDLTIQVQGPNFSNVRNSPLSSALQSCTLMMATTQFCKVVLTLAPNVEYTDIVIYNPDPFQTVDIVFDNVIIELFVFETSEDAITFAGNNGVSTANEDGTVCNDYTGVGGVLPDLAKFKSPIFISDEFAITQLVLSVNITHSDVGDIRMYLEGPEATATVLVEQGFTTGSGYSETSFASNGGLPLPGGIPPPYDGTFRPAGSFQRYNSAPSQGVWRLVVIDTNADGNTGELLDWSLRLCQ